MTTDKIALTALGLSAVAIVISVIALTYARRQAVAAEKANRISSRPTWRVQRHTTTKYKLLNVSEHVQTGVSIDGSRIECHHTGLPVDETMPPNTPNPYRFEMAAMNGETLPKFVYVRWDGMRPKPSRWKFWRARYEAIPVE